MLCTVVGEEHVRRVEAGGVAREGLQVALVRVRVRVRVELGVRGQGQG